jgi:hypothetical protein
MTKKDYQLIALTVKTVKNNTPVNDWPLLEKVAEEMADKLQSENPRFDRAKFLVACGFLA